MEITPIEGLIVRTKNLEEFGRTNSSNMFFYQKVFRGMLKKGIASISENFGA
jgi:hypothetical protein